MSKKIKRLNLAGKIEALIAEGITTSTGITARLQAEGTKISQPTISRYLNKVRDARQQETQQIVSEHVKAKLPNDLTALETMEAQCLDWTKENNEVFAHRLAEQHVLEAAPKWQEQIEILAHAPDPLKQKTALKEIMAMCLAWISDDLKMQTARLAAMRQAANIIELKLRFGVGEKSDGNIIFVDSERGDKLVKDEQSGRFTVIPGGA